ncbi:hypothetical protein F2Q69_00049782 [Brassica cretica]|uniref:Uncharacterized protein n=1 Tax=Brassica cretica TaxID=69181 RepID=A0A8S9PX16_BRACR|nr:hypothetical protein F2Q69_00049782 [Brassica cretica]
MLSRRVRSFIDEDQRSDPTVWEATGVATRLERRRYDRESAFRASQAVAGWLSSTSPRLCVSGSGLFGSRLHLRVSVCLSLLAPSRVLQSDFFLGNVSLSVVRRWCVEKLGWSQGFDGLGLGVLPVLLEFMFLLCMRLRFHGFMSAYRFIRLFGIWWRVVPSGFNILLASYTGDDTEKLGHTRKQSESLLLVSIVKGRE